MKSIYKIISILLLVLILGLMAVFNFKKKNPPTIIDYYKTLPDSFFFDKDLGNIKYALYQKKGVWVSKSIAGYELLPVVDLKKGYIKINDEGTGGGNVLIELFLFRKLNDTPLIGITMGGFDGFYFDSSTRFYEMKDKKWVVMKNALPKLGIARFLNNKYSDLYFQNNTLVKNNLTLLIDLLHIDNSASIKPNFGKYDYLITSKQNIYTGKPLTEDQYKQLLKAVKNICIESFQLKFNKKLGKFEIKDSILVRSKNTSTKLPNEDIIFNKLSNLKVVKELASYIDSASHKKRSLKLVLEEAQDSLNYITVKAVEDNGSNFVTHLIFKIQKNNFDISLYNPVDDKYVKIEQ